MKEIKITKTQAGTRLDRLLKRYLSKAPSGFIYKMLRKKNIKVNGSKAAGDLVLNEGDVINIYLSDETVEKFGSESKTAPAVNVPEPEIVYEDDNIVIINKPAGVLSQRDRSGAYSVNDQLIAHLRRTGEVNDESLEIFAPSIVNRLDRNTSGIVLCGKTHDALKALSEMMRERTAGKYYKCVVSGVLSAEGRLRGYLVKDERTNRVSVSPKEAQGGSYIETVYRPIETWGDYTLMEVELVTGKSHQIRAHLSSIGHPLVGDNKYGGKRLPPIKRQALHAYKISFPRMQGEFSYLSGRSFEAILPKDFKELTKYLVSIRG
ncbi:MAG: RluA family pseudouridine synthase [Eubacterium sp.]|nr:RluA family pseudouridine synthase [Eubacterium sp.]